MRSLVLMMLVSLSCITLYSCKESSQTAMEDVESFTMEHTSQNSLDWNGTYSGILKGLDGDTFHVSLSLEIDGIYSIELKEEGKNDIVKRNKINWSQDGQIIELYDLNELLNKFFVGENMLIQLNPKGELPALEERITYQLNKENYEIEN